MWTLNLKYLMDDHARYGDDKDFDAYHAIGVLYLDVLINSIIKRHVMYGTQGWKLRAEGHAGTIYLESESYPFIVWCTPFYEGSKGIEIAIDVNGGDTNPLPTLPFNITGDVNADTALFVDIMTKFLVEKIER